MTYCVIDLETTDKEYYKRVANPFYNRILCIGFKYEGVEFPLSYDWNKDEMEDEFQCEHPEMNLLIGHNIKFDLLYLWPKYWMQLFLNDNAGRIWDTQLAEYILSGQTHKYPALRKIAVNKYGCKERIKNIEEYYKQGISTENIPMEFLLKDVENDVMDTEQVYIQQVELAKENGMLNLIESQMDALLATTEMEYNGMFINKYILFNNKQQLEKELELNKIELNKLVKKYWIFK